MSDCPFTIGKLYRVRRAFTALRDSFIADEVLLFDSYAWSRYDGISGYFFRQPEREALRVWDVPDEENILVWKELFEELPDAVVPKNA
ncbi:MAG: hypothetical protein JWR15_895 [Prosthecobacter sp.]|nr:hypothetical protein [Prosthecobacter sp.]